MEISNQLSAGRSTATQDTKGPQSRILDEIRNAFPSSDTPLRLEGKLSKKENPQDLINEVNEILAEEPYSDLAIPGKGP